MNNFSLLMIRKAEEKKRRLYEAQLALTKKSACMLPVNS